MAALLDRNLIRNTSVAIDPPASDDGRPWPCPLCGRHHVLERLRLVEAERLRGTDRGRRFLLCLDCISHYTPHAAGE